MIVRGNRRIVLLASAFAILFVGVGASRAAESTRDVYFDAAAVGVTPGGFDTAATASPSAPGYAPLRSWSPDLSQPVEFTNLGPWSGYSSWKSDSGSGSFARVRVKSD